MPKSPKVTPPASKAPAKLSAIGYRYLDVEILEAMMWMLRERALATRKDLTQSNACFFTCDHCRRFVMICGDEMEKTKKRFNDPKDLSSEYWCTDCAAEESDSESGSDEED
jgi:hypothetical protein